MEEASYELRPLKSRMSARAYFSLDSIELVDHIDELEISCSGHLLEIMSAITA